MNELEKNPKGPIAWFARNHVAANLLMLMILAGGILSIRKIKVEIFPDMTFAPFDKGPIVGRFR